MITMHNTPTLQAADTVLDIDHAAHFVPDIDEAGAALERLGFTLTPFSAQRVTPDGGGPPVSAGTGNRCVMLQRGYIEFLAPTHDTPNARQLRYAMRRYTGIHLIAFGSEDGAADHARLTRGEFNPLPPIALTREVDTENGGSGIARFTVVRVPPGVMAEGRIQYCQHHTVDLVWQPRWIHHRNGITGLTGLIVCAADVDETAQRYTRFTGLHVHGNGETRILQTARGTVYFTTPRLLRERLNIDAPAQPWIAGTMLETNDFALTVRMLRDAGATTHASGEHCIRVDLPAALGGIMMVLREGCGELQNLFK